VSAVELVDSIVAVDLSTADKVTVGDTLDRWRRLKNWGESIEVACARRLSQLAEAEPSLYPERLAADAARLSLQDSMRRFDRAKTVETMPSLGQALQAGRVSGPHVDVVTSAMRGLEESQRAMLVDRQDQLALAAAALTRDEFARHVRREVKRLLHDDGVRRLEQQRRNTRLRSWVDRDTGMWCLRGEFDPKSGLLIGSRLQLMIDTLFHDKTPDTAPTDSVAKQEHLAALALLQLTEGGGTKGRTELVVMVDATTLVKGEHPHTFVDCGMEIDLPVETVRRMAYSAEVFVPMLSAANGVNLYHGREKRLASAPQRRLLRAMYPTCMMPGCEVPFDRCEVHHLAFYGRDFGLTDIDAQGPLCKADHRKVHEGRVRLALDELRNLTVTYPDGTTLTTGPPRRGGP
jgi:hypothetical protein